MRLKERHETLRALPEFPEFLFEVPPSVISPLEAFRLGDLESEFREQVQHRIDSQTQNVAHKTDFDEVPRPSPTSVSWPKFCVNEFQERKFQEPLLNKTRRDSVAAPYATPGRSVFPIFI